MDNATFENIILPAIKKNMKRTPEVMLKILVQFFQNAKSIDFSKYVTSELYPTIESQIRSSDENLRNDSIAVLRVLISSTTSAEFIKAILGALKSKPSSWFERSGLVRSLLIISQQAPAESLKSQIEPVVNTLLEILLRFVDCEIEKSRIFHFILFYLIVKQMMMLNKMEHWH